MINQDEAQKMTLLKYQWALKTLIDQRVSGDDPMLRDILLLMIPDGLEKLNQCVSQRL